MSLSTLHLEERQEGGFKKLCFGIFYFLQSALVGVGTFISAPSSSPVAATRQWGEGNGSPETPPAQLALHSRLALASGS